MADERINSVVNPEAEKQVLRLTESIKNASTELSNFQKTASGIELQLGDTTSIIQLNTLLKELGKNADGYTKVTNEQIKAEKERLRVEQELEKANQQRLKTEQQNEKLKREVLKTDEAINKARLVEEKQIKDLTNDYGMLSKAYNEMALRAKNYTLQLGANHPITLQAQADALALSNRLKALDASVGQYQRNVGNYNMVGMQFNQLLRELPNLAQSPQTFIMSLSNNISYFAESVKAARANGEGWGSILKGLGGNLFSLVGIVNIAVTATAFLANSFRDNKKSADDNAKSIKGLADEIGGLIDKENKLAQARGTQQGRGATAEQRKLDLLKAQGASNAAILAQERVVSREKQDALQREIDSYDVLRNEIRRTYQYYKDGGYREDVIREKMAVDKDLVRTLKDVTKATTAEAEAQAAKIAETYNTQESVIAGFNDRQIALRNELANESNNIAVKEAEFIKDAQKKAADAAKDTNKSYEELRRTLLELKAEFADVSDEMAAFAKELEADAKEQSETYNQFFKGFGDSLRKEIEAANGVSSKGQAEILANDLEQYEKRKKLKEKETRDWQQFYDNLSSKAAQTAGQIFDAFANAQRIRSESEINRLDDEKQRLDRNLRTEIEAINATATTTEEKERRIREAQATTEAQIIDIERRKTDQRRKAAQAQRNADIASAIADTSLAVIRALGDKSVPYPVRVGYAIAAGAAGAIQIATIRSTPLPEYEDGTLHHTGGKFIAGEKESELVITPSGKKYWTDDKPTMYNEPKGTKVLNSEMIATMMYGTMPKTREDKKLFNQVAEAIKDGTNKTVKAIRQQRFNNVVNLYGQDSYYNQTVKNKR